MKGWGFASLPPQIELDCRGSKSGKKIFGLAGVQIIILLKLFQGIWLATPPFKCSRAFPHCLQIMTAF